MPIKDIHTNVCAVSGKGATQFGIIGRNVPYYTNAMSEKKCATDVEGGQCPEATSGSGTFAAYHEEDGLAATPTTGSVAASS
jgi:hypothetical protein